MKATQILSQIRKTKPSFCQPFRNIPGPRPLPLIGNVWRYIPLIGDYSVDDLLSNAEFNNKRYGPIVREQITNDHTILHLFDPEDIRLVLNAESNLPYRRSHRALLKYRQQRPELYSDGGLFPENGLNWKRQRSTFQQRFMSQEYLSTYVSNLKLIATNSVNKLGFSASSDHDLIVGNLEELLSDWALECALNIFIGTGLMRNMSYQEFKEIKSELDTTLETIDELELKSSSWISNPESSTPFQRLAKSQDILYDKIANYADMIKENQYRDVDGSFLKDWLLIDKIEKKDIISMIMDCLLAGVHTSSYSLIFFIYHLCNVPKIQEDLRISYKSIDLSCYQDIEANQLLNACFKESLRLSPVSIGNGRVVTRNNLKVRNFEIPKGTMVILHTQTSSINPQIFDSPRCFIPSRWLKDDDICPIKKMKRNYACLPFGHGARICIGHRLVTLQIKIFILELLKRYSIISMDPIKTKSTLIHTIDGNVTAKFKPL